MRTLVPILAVLALTGLVPPAAGQLSPGKLSQPHAELDSNRSCSACHSSRKGVDPVACLSCHTVLAERIAADAGLHAGAEYSDCQTCHIEHHGREFELIWWGKQGRETFDHRQTGYQLIGAHQEAGCRDCHQAGNIAEPAHLRAAEKDLNRTFLGLETACASCHEDPHRQQFDDRACSSCHGQDSWTPATRFDHQRTGFALTGSHLEVACSDCHQTESGGLGQTSIRWAGTSTTCADCHSDPHGGRLGQQCEACHETSDWSRIDKSRFDHDRTPFPLRGKHRPLDCASCHRSRGSFRVAEFASCESCHADNHAGQFRARADGGACESCHDPRGFMPSRFDAEDHSVAGFELLGAHREAACNACHPQTATAELVERGFAIATAKAPALTRQFVGLASACTDCHYNPHGAEAETWDGETSCSGCHGVDSFSAVDFDHDRTGFVLEGLHRVIACADCHQMTNRGSERAEVRFAGAPTACRDCHSDPHLGQFDQPPALAVCTDCHALEGWLPSTFDHAKDTSFALEGGHARAACSACHAEDDFGQQTAVRFRPTPRACADCHQTGGAS